MFSVHWEVVSKIMFLLYCYNIVVLSKATTIKVTILTDSQGFLNKHYEW